MHLSAALGANRRMTNVQLVARLDTSARRRDIHGAWQWYQKLLHRRTLEQQQQQQPTSTSPSRIVPRRQLHSTLAYPLDDTMLSTLSHKYLAHHTASDLTTLRHMITTTVANLQRTGGTLSAARLVQLLDVCAAAGAGAEGGALADALWQQAALGGGVRDAACYNAYANAQMRAGRLREAEAVVREMDEGGAGVRATSYTRSLAIRLHGYAGDLAMARRVFDGVRQGLVGPVRPVADYLGDAADLGTAGLTLGTYEAMLDVLGMNGLLDEMFCVFAELCGHPSAESIERLAELVASDRLEDKKNKNSKRVGRRPRASTFLVVLRWHAKYWDVRGCVRWIEGMQRMGVRPDERVVRAVVTRENAMRELQLCGGLVVRLAEDFGVQTPRQVLRIMEKAARGIEKMHRKVEHAMGQPSKLWGP